MVLSYLEKKVKTLREKRVSKPLRITTKITLKVRNSITVRLEIRTPDVDMARRLQYNARQISSIGTYRKITMKKIYLVRHGETESNRKGIFRGRLDILLSQRGKDQARDLRDYFKTIPLQAVYSSPLQRAIETAETAFPGLSPLVEPLIDNLDLGEWSGQNKNLVEEKFPQQWEAWVKRPESIRFPGGESLGDVLSRCRLFLQKVLTSEVETLAAVSHRSVVKVLLAAALGLEKNYYWRFHLDNASVSQVYYEAERGFTIVKVNDTRHLKETVMEWY
jgi:broad specificity phosphatase PhoE